MGRFSPTVLPEYAGGNVGEELAKAFAGYAHTKLAEREAQDQHDVATGTYVANGGRYGRAPTREEPVPVLDTSVPRSLAGAFDELSRGHGAAMPSSVTDRGAGGAMPQSVLDPGIGGGLARALSDHRPASAPRDEDSTGGGWGAAMPGAPPASPFGSALADRFAQGDGPAPADALRALTHGGGAPGSFQPGLGGFAPASPAAAGGGATPATDAAPRTMAVNDPRYIETGPDRYIDTRQTRQGQALAQAMAMMDARNAGAWDRASLGASTRREIAEGNNDTRRQISDDRLGTQQDIADQRTENSQDLAELRDATTRLGIQARAGAGARGITATSREANAFKSAKALLALHGSKDAALAVLTGPSGEDFRAAGVTPRHLEVAAGEQVVGDTRAAMHGSSIPSNPVRAAGKVAGVRSAVLESGMSDADLWEKKRKDGLSAADATAYVNARTKH